MGLGEACLGPLLPLLDLRLCLRGSIAAVKPSAVAWRIKLHEEEERGEGMKEGIHTRRRKIGLTAV